jgi:hypothetical protein
VRNILLVCLTCLGVACAPSVTQETDPDPVEGVDGGGELFIDAKGESEFADAPPQEPCANMDILFVVDNSASMVEEQSSLAANFPLFLEVLDTYETEDNGLLDYRIAVTTSGTDANPIVSVPGFGTVPLPQTGANGAFQQDCGMTRPWLERSDDDVAGKFSCIAQVGTGGPDFEMQLYATKLALTRADNGPFVRDDALLAIVIVTDEDDCSVEDGQEFTVPNDTCKPAPPEMLPVDHYLAFLDDLKLGRDRWAAAVIAGDASCPDSFRDGERLREFVARAGDNVIHSPICVDDLSTALQEAIDNFDAACQAMPPID